MKKWRYILIIAVLLYCVYALIPTVRFYTMPSDERLTLAEDQKAKYLESAIKLGLDLQGGMHLVLEVASDQLDSDARKDALDRVLKIIRNRVDQFGVSEPVIQKQGDRRVIVQLPGLQDAERAKNLIGQTALLEFRMVREQEDAYRVLKDLDLALMGVEVKGAVVDSTGQVDTQPSGEEQPPVGEEEAATAEIAQDTTAVEADTTVAKADTTKAEADTALASVLQEQTAFDTLIPTLPGTEDIEVPLEEFSEDRPFTSYLTTLYGGAAVVDERNRQAVDLLLSTSQAQRVLPRNTEFLWESESRPLEGGGTGRLIYLVEKTPILTGRTLVNATTRPDPDDPSSLNVSFQLNREGALIFSRVTGENIGRRIAIVLDRKIRSAPVVQTKIPGGEGRITGQFTDEEANDLAIVLRAGALPAPVDIIEERTVGPTLGRDSIVLGVRAALVGFVLVMIFMLVYYRLSGLLACAALVFNLAIVLAALAQLRAALTLPGIAGLILTIGMAVDANVLIFERIREELAKAKTVRSAIDSGYDRAFTTILDANITTLITAFVLWQFGTGPIKGFATTLSIGIIASMFTALLCTRVVYHLITARWAIRKLSI
ncbi:MAG: protein translocase subunit SecD [Candidatus Latescibacterota bacterium]|nr:MAG: protein translocase subunit SecD [Candidatus Latescibacterota bacterium]